MAIPYYSNKNKKRPISIDSERAFKRLLNSYVEGVPSNNLNMIKSFLYANADLAYKLTINRSQKNEFELVKGIEGNKVVLKKPNSKIDWSADKKLELYKSLFKLKLGVLKNSALLSFDDAYFYANEYLLNYPQIKLAISKRFSHVFIDEMQDTYSHQNKIITEIFNNKIIIQRIGDSNQAILNDNYAKSAWEITDHLKITGSRRFSQPIANILKTVALNGDINLRGIKEIKIQPHIIRYKEGKESEVLEEFVLLIKRFNLDTESMNDYPIKAVGWVGKDKDGLTIGNYFHAFNKSLKTGRSNLHNLKTAITRCNSFKPKEVFRTIMDCCLEIFALSNIKNVTSEGERYYNMSSFLYFLKHTYPEALITFQSKISFWNQLMVLGNLDEALSDIRKYLKDELFAIIKFTVSVKGQTFIDSNEIEGPSEEQLEINNTFNSKKMEFSHIPVEIGTVHSVKGETHRATMYLETFFHKKCGDYLIDQMIGNKYDGKGGKRKDMCLKIAHVAMSRPTHLLCVALNKTLVDKRYKELENNGWKII